MEVLIRYKVDLKDGKLCLGCPFSYVKEEGVKWFGEWCDCSSEDRCNCSPPTKSRDKDKDKWHCKIFDLSLGIGQIPHRNKKCDAVNSDDTLEIKRLHDLIVKIKKECSIAKSNANKNAILLSKKEAQLMKFTDSKYWVEVTKNILKEMD